MKTRLLLLALIFPFCIFGQKSKPIDDIYFTPSDARKMAKENINNKENYEPINKKGIKEITFVERTAENKNIPDSLILIEEANDSTEMLNEEEEGYYLNGFKGNENDLEYAQRIRKFHNPKYRIFIGDPGYSDIYFMNNNDWNVYIDDYYAYVTPTWTNPYWYDYNYGHSYYNNWGWGNYYSNFGYNSWYSPWGYNSFYGGWNSYYGYSGWGNPYYHGYNHGYYGHYGYNHWNNPYYYGNNYYSSYNKNYSDSYRRSENGYNTRSMESTNTRQGSNNNTRSMSNAVTRQSDNVTIGGGGSRSSLRSNYTAIEGEGRTISNASGTRSINTYSSSRNSQSGMQRDVNVQGRSNSYDRGASSVRSSQITNEGNRNTYNNSNNTNTSRTSTRSDYNPSSVSGRSSYNTTRPVVESSTTRPSVNSSQSSRSTYTPSTSSSPRTTYSTGTPSSSSRSSQSTYSQPSSSRSSSSNSYSSPSRSSESYSSPSRSSSYSAPSSSSGSSYSGGSSSSSSGSSSSGSSGGGGGGGSRR